MDQTTDSSRQSQNHVQEPASKTNPLANYQFSPDELRVLKECNTESFFQRSLPLGIALGLGTFFGVKNGMIKGHIKWGATPKVMVAVTLGYFLGKFSYQKACADKLMLLPNSHLAVLLKQRKKGGFNESLSLEHGFGTAISIPAFSSAAETYSDLVPDQNRSLDIDTERPHQKGLDESFRPSVDVEKTPSFEDENLMPPQSQTTYEELRRKNRDDYQKNRTQDYRGVLGGDDIPAVVRPKEAPTSSKSKKNIYGDSLD